MPKRKNGRWEQVITFENCYAAVEEVLKNRHFPSMGSKIHTPNRRDIERIVRHRAKHPPKPGYITWCMEHKEDMARRLCSYKGIMLPANSRTVYETYIRKNTWRKCRRVISYVDILCAKAGALYGGAAA